MNLLERAIQFISPKWAFEREAYRNAIEAVTTTQYTGAARDGSRGNWDVGATLGNPPSYELKALRDRSRDANRNDPLAKAITGTYATNIAGTGLQLQSKLRADRLGISEEQADALRREIEDVFDAFARDCDASGRLSFDDMQFLTVQKIVEDGESISIPIMRKEQGWHKFNRAIQLIGAERLAQPPKNKSATLPDGGSNDTGIEVDSYGAPVKYWIQKAGSLSDFEPIPARDAEGRPMILHVFRQTQPGQLRGIPLVAPVLAMLKDFSGVMESTVMRARVAACLAVIMTKANPVQAMLGNATANTATKTKPSERMQELFPGMIHYADQGDTAQMLDPSPDGSSFDPFVSVVIRLVCASIGLPYELVIKDFSKTNYSSARAALLEGRRTFNNWRTWLGKNYCQPVFELILEEAVYAGLINLPKFDLYKSEYFRAQWIGGGWGWVDPVKEIEASNMAIESGLSTLADECAANGKDWEENLSQRKREIPAENDAGVMRLSKNASGNLVPINRPDQTQQARRSMVLAASIMEKN